MLRLPRNRAPAHPGRILQKEYLVPLRVSKAGLAERIGVPVKRIDEIIKEKRGLNEETAHLFATALSTSPGFWLNLQHRWDLYHATPSELIP
jgi:antitoxin HigA-1